MFVVFGIFFFFGNVYSAHAGNSISVTRGQQPLMIGWQVAGGYETYTSCAPSSNATPLALKNAWLTGGGSLYGNVSLPKPTDIGTFSFTCTHALGASDTANLTVTDCTGGLAWDPGTSTCVPGNADPIGALDSASCTSIDGWAFDPDAPATSILVHLYDGGTYVGQFTANTSRPDVNNAYGITGNHGFSIPTPSSLKDGLSHSLTVYSINTPAGNNPPTSGSPKTISGCTPPVPTIDITPKNTTGTVGVPFNYTVTSSGGSGSTMDTVNWIAPNQGLWNWQNGSLGATVSPGNGYSSFPATSNKTTVYSFTPSTVGTYTILGGVLDYNATRWTTTPNYTLVVTAPGGPDTCGPGSGTTPKLSEPTGTEACAQGTLNSNSPADTTLAWNWSCGTVTSCSAPKYGCTTPTDTNYNASGPNNVYGCANTCANGAPIATYPSCTVQAAPTIDDVTINSPTVTANGSTQYTITVTASNPGGGSTVTEEYANINYQGPNAGSHRGYIGFSLNNVFTRWTGWFKPGTSPITCSGGGWGAIYGGNGPEYINLISCSTSISGNTRTASFVVSFNSNFTTPTTNNTLSGWMQNSSGVAVGWLPFNTFNLAAGANLGIVVSPASYTATIQNSTASVTYTLTNGTSGNTQCRLLDYQQAPITSYAPCTGGMSVTAPSSEGTYGYFIEANKTTTGETAISNNFVITVVDSAVSGIFANPNPCVVITGQSTCTSYVSWINPSGNSDIYKNYFTWVVANSPSGSGQNFTVSPATSVIYIRKDYPSTGGGSIPQRDAVTISAVCEFGSNWNTTICAPAAGSCPAPTVLTTGTSWTVPAGVTSVKVWAIGAGGGGAGTPAQDDVASGAGGAGGVAYKTYSVSGGQTIAYTIGSGGPGGSGAQLGTSGGVTTATYGGTTITAGGGQYGQYNNNAIGPGGNGLGGDGAAKGGTGAGSSGNQGGGGGGGLGGGNGTFSGTNGGTGGQSVDVSGLQAAVTSAGYSWTGPGGGGGNVDLRISHGKPATGFGSGGGGAGFWGGHGGDGLYGGGGGGAAGSDFSRVGGAGGRGAVVIQPVTCAVTNTAPNPPTITGPTTGVPSTSYTYTFTATDPDGDTLRYEIDWDNNGTVDQTLPATGYVASGPPGQSQANNWTGPGTKNFQARAVDSLGAISGWSPYTVTINTLGGIPDLVGGETTFSPSPGTYGQSISFNGYVANWGPYGAVAYDFPNFFQIQSENYIYGAAEEPNFAWQLLGYADAGRVASLQGNYQSTIVNSSYTFTPFDNGIYRHTGNYIARVCTNLTGYWTQATPESNTDNNCGSWATVVVSSASNTCTSSYFCWNGERWLGDPNVGSPPCPRTLQACPANFSCSNGACIPPPPIDVVSMLKAAPSLVKSGASSFVSWQVRNAASCTVTGSNGDSWTGLYSGTSGQPTSPKQTSAILGQTTYTLNCTALQGANPPSLTAVVLVNIIPIFIER
jgi:hypothetical protein